MVGVIAIVSTVSYVMWPKHAVPANDAGLPVVASQADQITLTPEKQQAAGLHTTRIARRELQPERIVPGRLAYDETRHVELRMPTEGVVRELRVRPGVTVMPGQVVAVVESPEIGERRADVLLRASEAQLADRERQQASTVQTTLQVLLARLKELADLPALQKDFEGQNLGDYREPLFTAYSKLLVADRLIAKLRPLANEGIASGRSFIEQEGQRETALAAFQAACETSRFQAAQRHFKAETAAADAQRRLAIAKERLASLIGAGAATPMADEHQDDAISLWTLRAPISGTIEELKVAANERVTPATGLMIVADTTSLWVQAELRDRDWSALKLTPGQTVRVELAAQPGESVSGEVLYVGRVQSESTRAVPLVVRVANTASTLRPGMFARVALPAGEPREVVAAPATAVMRHDRRRFVFVEETPGEYHAVDVVTGIEADGWVELKSGPKDGENVVSEGTFFLKSELLLETEE